MTIKEFLLSTMLSLTSALGIYYVTSFVKERKWLNLTIITTILLLVTVLLFLPQTNNFLINTSLNSISIPLIISLLVIFILLLILTQIGSQLYSFRRLKSSFIEQPNKDVEKKNGFWKYTYIEKEKGNLDKNSSELKYLELIDKTYFNKKFLYQLIMPSGYNTYELSFLNPYKDTNTQLGIVHIIHQENYISWIDIIYWRILKYFSNHRISVHVFVSNRVAINKTFMAYLKFYLGKKVIIDDSLFSSLKLADELDTVEEKDCNNPFEDRKPFYNRLRYFSQFSPLILAKKHTFILLWEGYYTIFKFYKSIKNKENNSIELKSNSLNHEITVDLCAYRTEFLVAPTCMKFNLNGDMNDIKPGETFLLGVNSDTKTLKKIHELNNYSLKTICHQVICPGLSWLEKILFILAANILIYFRKEPSSTSSEKSNIATKLISKLFVFSTGIIHNRVIKNAGL